MQNARLPTVRTGTQYRGGDWGRGKEGPWTVRFKLNGFEMSGGPCMVRSNPIMCTIMWEWEPHVTIT